MPAAHHPGRDLAFKLFAEHLPTATIADRTGADRRSVKRWRAEYNEGRGKGKARTPARSAPARARDADDLYGDTAEDADPDDDTDATPTGPVPSLEEDPIGYHRAMLAQAQHLVSVSVGKGHTQAASTWAALVDKRGTALALALEQDKRRRDRDARAKVRDPGELVRRLVANAPAVVSHLGAADRPAVERLQAALAAWIRQQDEDATTHPSTEKQP